MAARKTPTMLLPIIFVLVPCMLPQKQGLAYKLRWLMIAILTSGRRA
jgi:hypothetical protein